MQTETQVGAVNVGRSVVYALLAVGAVIGWSTQPGVVESIGCAVAWVWWSIAALLSMPGRFKVVRKDAK